MLDYWVPSARDPEVNGSAFMFSVCYLRERATVDIDTMT